ncbi:uncharacterized protein LOC115739878 isoform X2 [Rhodamnia argentea]|uniref:Uncharacterized protein LOC115739878 isoform X2 n=1 Tax=Rhodamnia argentea TaxID=178133 RepID=A0A8B8P2M4_9MYRT|nr:uncharacterized protein LOC115739878 isoform X2 [Rhodamnia argentea]
MDVPVDAGTCDGLELEAMRTVDSSWLPCTVTLSPFGRGLLIDFGSQEPEDMILTEPEVLKRLRFRSIPLQGGDCSHIEQGKHVLAACESQFPDCFYDAEVEKVLRIRHSKRINCRCTFTVKLLRKDVKGETLTVSSSSIMRLAEKSIKDHPVISEFLKSVESQTIYSASPFFPVNQENGVEDLDRMLEKRKGCYMFDDPKHGISRDILFGIGMKVEKNGQAQRRLIDEFDASNFPVQGPEEPIRSEASAQDPVKLQLDEEVEVPLPFSSSIFELSNSKSRLSPLAARAALASIVSAAHSVLTNGTEAGNSCIIRSVSPRSDKSLQVPSPSIPVASESIDSRATEMCSTNETKVREPTKIARITRSTARGGPAATNYEDQIKSCKEEIQKRTLANTRRFTRSSGLADRENAITVEQGLDYDLTRMTTSNRSSTKRKVSQKKEKVSSPVDTEFHGLSKEKVEKTVDNKRKIEDKTSGAKQKDGEETSDALENVEQNKGYPSKLLGFNFVLSFSVDVMLLWPMVTASKCYWLLPSRDDKSPLISMILLISAAGPFA